jgi:hypothetical protein
MVFQNDSHSHPHPLIAPISDTFLLFTYLRRGSGRL